MKLNTKFEITSVYHGYEVYKAIVTKKTNSDKNL